MNMIISTLKPKLYNMKNIYSKLLIATLGQVYHGERLYDILNVFYTMKTKGLTVKADQIYLYFLTKAFVHMLINYMYGY